VLPKPLAVFKGPTSKGSGGKRRGKGGEGKGRKGRGGGGREGGKVPALIACRTSVVGLIFGPPKNFVVAPPVMYYMHAWSLRPVHCTE